MKDSDFPIITYPASLLSKQRGELHGETHRNGIKELAEIRRELMLAKNPKLSKNLKELALEQFEITKRFDLDQAEEINGIARGAGISLESAVILNNYTDFRDIELPEEGCSTIHVQRPNVSLAGQTWDMHRSAKNYLCLIHVKSEKQGGEALVLSLLGCVGLMGLTAKKTLVGVNNINTKNARTGLIWPALVRSLLKKDNLKEMRELVQKAPVTSGHNYILSDSSGGEHWEVTPEVAERVALANNENYGVAFHTNHCLGPKVQKIEDKKSMSSTTHARYELLEKKLTDTKTLKDLTTVLTDHEGHPKSICSHFESGTQDPSFTCGGGMADLISGESHWWRGCPTYDQTYRSYNFNLIPEELTFQRK
jgi:isopenicillin-N N-acyltransferase-like protein